MLDALCAISGLKKEEFMVALQMWAALSDLGE